MIISKSIRLYRKTRERIVFECECDQCHKYIELPPNRIKRKYQFCSKECQRLAQLTGGLLDKLKRDVCMNNFGDDHPMRNDKIKNSFINPFSRQDVKDKIKKTSLERYGVDNAMKCDVGKQNLKQSIIQKYGTLDCFNKLLLQKRTATNLKRYGVENPLQRPEIIAKQKATMASRGVKQFQSKLELRIGQLLQQEFSEVQTQKWINGRPIDFFLPEINVFIQVDGEFYHGLTERARQYAFVLANVERDKIQNDWFYDNKLKMLRLPESQCRSITSTQLKDLIISFAGQSA